MIDRIGLDRVVLSSFRIISINFEKLLQHNNVELDKDGENNYLLNDNKSFRWLKIEDLNMFGTLCAGTKKTTKMKQDYSRIDITIKDKEVGNLQNITVKEYQQKVLEIFTYLKDEYGVVISNSNTCISQMEINCTFETSQQFYKYHRLLRLWMFNLPGSFKKLGQYSGINKKEQRLESETFFRGNSMMEIKIYDKTKQLNETYKYKIRDNFMRIEFILKKPQKIKEAFGTNRLSEITDEDINRYFYKQFLRLIENPYRKWQRENSNELSKLIWKYRKKCKNNWINKFLTEVSNREQVNQIPILLSVDDLLIRLKFVDKEHYGRVSKSVLEQCRDNDIYLQNDSTKAEEIISRVHDMYETFIDNQVMDRYKIAK